MPGTDLALANGLLYLAIRLGYVDTDYIADHTSGFEQVRRVVRSYWPDRVERITGVPVAQLDEARPVTRRGIDGHGAHRPGCRAAP